MADPKARKYLRKSFFVSDFMKMPVPKEERWMTRYFKTRTKKLFLKYFLAFGSATRFCQHSGEVCTKRYVKKMKMQFLKIRNLHDKAKTDFDLEFLSKIKVGKIKLK